MIRSTLTNKRVNIAGHDPVEINVLSFVSTPFTDITTDALINLMLGEQPELILY